MHVDVHGVSVMLWVTAMYLLAILTEHGRYGLSCLYAETVETMSSAGYVWYVWVCMVYGVYGMMEYKLCCEI